MLATVTDKGQLTVPKAIRDQFGIEPGTKLDFEPQPDGSLRVRVLARGSASLFGLLHTPGRKAKTVAEMDEGIGAAVKARAKR
ncbi:AbrB/MazE/SpoVT family DNA-binding domain-containing protein [Burkholderiaceae bacterium UC74_6]